MKNFLIVSFIVAVALFGIKAFADVTIQNNSLNPPLGRADQLNEKGCTVTIAGMIATVDCSSLSNVNWTSVFTINPISYSNDAINWASFKYGQPNNTSGINWQAFGV